MKSKRIFPRLIHFFGPDGAGKTTHVEILTQVLRRRGFRAKKYWVRAHHTLAFVLWKFFVRIGFYRIVLNPVGARARIAKLPAVDRNDLLRRFWSAVELIGVLPVILRAYYSMWRGRTLVAERYVLDTVTTIAYFLNDINFLRSWTSRLILRFIPEDTVFIFLDADYNSIHERRTPLVSAKTNPQIQKKHHVATQRVSVEPRIFIEFQRRAYKVLGKSFNALVIDTSKHSIEETSTMILRYLGLN